MRASCDAPPQSALDPARAGHRGAKWCSLIRRYLRQCRARFGANVLRCTARGVTACISKRYHIVNARSRDACGVPSDSCFLLSSEETPWRADLTQLHPVRSCKMSMLGAAAARCRVQFAIAVPFVGNHEISCVGSHASFCEGCAFSQASPVVQPCSLAPQRSSLCILGLLHIVIVAAASI